MVIFVKKTYLLALLIPLLIASTGYAKGSKTLPDFSLKDPAGKTFTKKDILKNGAVVVITAPILSNKSAQEGWDKVLEAVHGGHKGKLVLVEDMTPSMFKKAALKGMRKDYRPGKEPILLIDNDGTLRKKLGVERKKTVVFAFDHNGKMMHKEAGKPNSAAAKKLWSMTGK